MKILLNKKNINTIVLFQSDFGRHVTVNQFNPEEIWKKISDELTSNDLTIMRIRNEDQLTKLFEFDDEYDFVDSIRSEKFIKELLRTNREALELIEDSFFGRGHRYMTMVVVIDVKKQSYEFLSVVGGDHVDKVLESLNSWVDSPIWEGGIELLSELLEYLENLDIIRVISDDLESDHQDFIDPRLN